MLLDQPSRREYNEVKSGVPTVIAIIRFVLAWAGENSEDAGVRMVVRNRANCVVVMEIVLEWSVISSPSDSVEGRIVALGLVYLTDVLVVNLNRAVSTLNSPFLS